MMQMALLATGTMTATWMEAVSPQAPLPVPQMDITGMDTRATMTTAVSSAPMVMELHAMAMAALSVATMEMKMAARSLSGGGYFLPYREVRNMHFLLAIFLECFKVYIEHILLHYSVLIINMPLELQLLIVSMKHFMVPSA